MTDIRIFENTEFGNMRTMTEDDGRVLFCGKDVAAALGYSNTNKAINDHCKGGVTKRYLIDALGREQEAAFIPEGDVYRLICNSKLPSAEKFERWVFDEVLPAIRKTGRYGVKETASYPTRQFTSDDYIKAAQLISSCRNERLPYVLYLLGKAGFDLEKVKRLSDTREDVEE